MWRGTWRATTEPGTLGAYSPILRTTRSPSSSRRSFNQRVSKSSTAANCWFGLLFLCGMAFAYFAVFPVVFQFITERRDLRKRVLQVPLDRRDQLLGRGLPVRARDRHKLQCLRRMPKEIAGRHG